MLRATVVSIASVAAAEPTTFTVTDIRVEGLQRIPEGTVFNQLPVNIGDVLSPRRVMDTRTGFYAPAKRCVP